jgi:VWFA-related protein
VKNSIAALAACLAACLLLTAGARAQQQPFNPDKGFTAPALDNGNAPPQKVFKASTRLVVVDVVVTDKRGGTVSGLRESDFHVLENGREQRLRSFEERRSDGIYTASPSFKSDGKLVQASNAGQENNSPALNVILFDALDTASSDQSFARAQVKKVIAQLPAGSRIALFVLRDDLHMVQGFTTDTVELAAAMERNKSTLSGPWFNDDPEDISGDTTPGQSAPRSYLGSTSQRDERGLTSQLRTAKTLMALKSLAAYLSALPGRKNLMWLAGTFPFDLLPDTTAGSGQNVPDAFRGTQTYGSVMYDLALQMEAGHIAVYPIDVRGLVAYGGPDKGGVPNMLTMNAITGAEMSQHEVMENIALETGGRAIYDDNDLRGAIIQTLNQGGHFYTLAYSPEDKNWNGKYRRIDVTTAAKDVHLFYRHGYLADDPGKPGEQFTPESAPKFSVAMLRGAPERAEVVMTVKADATGRFVEEKDRKPVQLQEREKPIFATHLSGTTEVYALSCTIDAKTVTFQKGADGKYTPHLALTFLAYDADGKVLNAVPGLFNMPLTEAQYHAVLARGLTVNQQMEIPVGYAWLRVGVHDLPSDKVGATEMPLVIRRAPAQTAMAK